MGNHQTLALDLGETRGGVLAFCLLAYFILPSRHCLPPLPPPLPIHPSPLPPAPHPPTRPPHAGVLCEQFLRERGILPRGLAHPVIFSQTFGGGDAPPAEGAAAGSGSGASSSNGGGGGGARGVEVAPWDPSRTLGDAFMGGQGGGGSGADSRCTSVCVRACVHVPRLAPIFHSPSPHSFTRLPPHPTPTGLPLKT